MKPLAKSPLAPAHMPDMPHIDGVRLIKGRAGYTKAVRDDVLLARLAKGSVAAGVVTQSKTCSPEVDWCKAALSAGQGARALWVNAGNSNAFTGSAGQAAVDGILAGLADEIGIQRDQIYLSSTGVIGVPLPIDKARAAIKTVCADDTVATWEAAARAIMTTDTFPKVATRTVRTSGGAVTLSAIAKGSGMIAPDMATMLAFTFTDARIAQADLQMLLARATATSFNAITVDGDTSTSDTYLAFATQRSGALLNQGSADFQAFGDALTDLSQDLAQQIVRDGEGASKFITVEVTGAQSDASARTIALSIANSPLVKTAIAGEDANWGRVVMAVGKAGEPADRDRLSISFGGHMVAKDGQCVDGYDEAPVAAHLQQQDIQVGADIGIGTGAARVWTCDLTHGYISINADYRS